MQLIIGIILALVIGWAVGRVLTWSWWHGPAAAILILPVLSGSDVDPLLSALIPMALGVGFVVSRTSA